MEKILFTGGTGFLGKNAMPPDFVTQKIRIA